MSFKHLYIKSKATNNEKTIDKINRKKYVVNNEKEFRTFEDALIEILKGEHISTQFLTFSYFLDLSKKYSTFGVILYLIVLVVGVINLLFYGTAFMTGLTLFLFIASLFYDYVSDKYVFRKLIERMEEVGLRVKVDEG